MRFVIALAVVAAAAPAAAQRLPATVTPIHYDLTIAPDLASATFTGQATIRVLLANPSAAIVLNAAEIRFKDVRVAAQGRTQTAKVTLDDKQEQATIQVPSPVPAGEVEISISYDGILNSDLRGLYLSEANQRRYAVTQLQATDARRMFPSFDEPAFKATFALTAIVDQKDHAISNGAIVSDTPGPTPGRHTIKFAPTPKMSTYLVALAVGDFECNETSADGIPVRVCATPDKKHLTTLALQAAKQQVEYFNRYYSLKYPFKKLDVVAVPDFAPGAMENTAAIFYRETMLLADEHASVDTRKSIAKVLAHEIAHQWFGNIVTMQWWDDIWLNEGFANWMMSKPVKAFRPDWALELDELGDNHYAMSLDSLRSTRPIRARANTPAEISELFDPIAYEKGAAVIRMVEAWLGEEAFRKGVNAYLEKFAYGNARAEDFWATLTTITGKPVDRVMASFVDQPGLPLVSFDVRCNGKTGEIALSQERYIRDGTTSPSTTEQWQIPVCFRIAGGNTSCELLTAKRTVVPVDSCPAWTIGNAGGRGYYRTASSIDTVRELSRAVPKLTPVERMAVLSDEWALARASHHDVGATLDLAAGFGQERTPQVMQGLAGILSSAAANLTTEATKAPFRAWIRELVSPSLEELGMTPQSTDTDDMKLLRATLMGLLGGAARDERVLARARAIVKEELAKPASVDPTLLSLAVDLAAIEGDSVLYDQYLARSRAAVSPEERERYLYGLTSFTNTALVKRTFDLALSSDVRSQDAQLVIGSLLANRDAADQVWTLVRERWDEIQKKTGESVGNTNLVSALGRACRAGRADEIEKFFATHKVPDAERTLQQSLESIRSCARFAESQGPNLAAWLKGR
ncbi:MAG TPA: M1 family metallopeptidase [Vicinamibacterales bacterium]|nr:M1 family metallopeptidase [Vicinamibacterales bacterium]